MRHKSLEIRVFASGRNDATNFLVRPACLSSSRCAAAGMSRWIVPRWKAKAVKIEAAHLPIRAIGDDRWRSGRAIRARRRWVEYPGSFWTVGSVVTSPCPGQRATNHGRAHD
jgi:hypothetical protein